MKCSHCGGSLTLKDEYCPHCGQLNEQSVQHIRDMKHYEGQFKETKQGVWARLWKYQGVSVRVVVLAVMAILIIAAWLANDNLYSIERSIINARSARNVESNIEQINAYLEAEEYIDLYYFMETNRLGTYANEEYEAYIPLERASCYYGLVYEEILLFALGEEPESYLDSLGSDLELFYSYADPETLEYYEGADTEQARTAFADMREKVRALLITYCGMTEEEAEGFPAMKSAKRTVLLSEKRGL